MALPTEGWRSRQSQGLLKWLKNAVFVRHLPNFVRQKPKISFDVRLDASDRGGGGAVAPSSPSPSATTADKQLAIVFGAFLFSLLSKCIFKEETLGMET